MSSFVPSNPLPRSFPSLLSSAFLAAAFALTACTGDDDSGLTGSSGTGGTLTEAGASADANADAGSDGAAFSLASTDVPNGGTLASAQILNTFGCTGSNVSPELHWTNPPAGTKSYALTMFDPDAPTGSGFWHWTVFNIPASATSLPGNAGLLDSGIPLAGAVQGYTDLGQSGYGGPCPPVGDPPHHYVFTLHALSTADLGLTAGAPGALVSFAAKGSAIASATLTATYGRTGAPTPHPEVPTYAGFTLSSAEVSDGGTIANEQVLNAFGCMGGDVSPSLQWSGAPPGTSGFVLTMYDPDAPTGSGFWHWLVFNIPASATSIPKGAGSVGSTPAGGTQGYGDLGINGYGGPCPPPGTPHRYVFTLYAVNTADLTTLGLSSASTGGFIGFNLPSIAIAKAQLTATYGR